MKKKYSPPCACIDKMNKQLEATNMGELNLSFGLLSGKVYMLVATSAPKKKGRFLPKPPKVLCSYCPFCGIDQKVGEP